MRSILDPLRPALAVLLLSTLTACGKADTAEPEAPPSGKPWLSGVACPDGAPNAGFGAWRNRPVTIAGIWADKDEPNQRHIYWLDEFKAWDGHMDIAPGLLDRATGSIESYAEAASGAYDERWRQSLRSIHARWGDKKTLYLRPAHEMTGNWYRWAVTQANVNEFKQAWVRYHAMVQAELVAKGRDVKLVFNPNWDSHSDASIDEIYPGDAVVDIIGVDYYDHYPSTETLSAWNDKLRASRNGSPRGIEAWREWALKRGKPMAFPEWGLNPEKPIDNPFFIRQMHAFFARHAGTGPGQVVYEIYFNCYDITRLHPRTQAPKAAEAYRQLNWGGSAAP